MAIPALINIGGVQQLPPGEHPTTLVEISATYGMSSPQRIRLMGSLLKVADTMKNAKVKRIWIDGSFVTDKKGPNDIDGCWSASGVLQTAFDAHMDPLFADPNARTLVKNRYDLDFYIAEITEAKSGLRFPEFFQTDRNGNKKGILVVDL